MNHFDTTDAFAPAYAHTTSTFDVDHATVPDVYDDMSDPLSIDLDLDGYAETTVVDLDGDGIVDLLSHYDVATGAETVLVDLDGDGIMETVGVDEDGDGTFETLRSDTDGDGVPDTDVSAADTDGSGDDDTPFTTDPSLLDDSCTMDGDLSDGVDGADESDDDIHGDPMAEIPYHQAQPGEKDCMPTSVAMVLSDLTGSTVDADDVVATAHDLGLMMADGMTAEGGAQLLEHYGIDAEVQQGTLDELRTMLDQGTDVIIGLDSDDLYGSGDAPFADDIVAGHAVVITGIDDEAGVVYVNDPGFPDGAGVAIPIDQFEDAWTDFGHTMVVASSTDADTTTVDAGGIETPAADDGHGFFDLVLLPLTFVVR